MPHPLVTQLRFTRSEWIRGLKPVTAEEAARRFGPINPIAWMIGHHLSEHLGHLGALEVLPLFLAHHRRVLLEAVLLRLQLLLLRADRQLTRLSCACQWADK